MRMWLDWNIRRQRKDAVNVPLRMNEMSLNTIVRARV
jgi:hypothetical protein